MSVSLSEDQLKKANDGINVLMNKYPASSDPTYQQKIDLLNENIKKTPKDKILQYQLNYFKEQITKASNAIDILSSDYPSSSDPTYQQKIDLLNDKIMENPKDALLQYQLNYFTNLQKTQKTDFKLNKDEAGKYAGDSANNAIDYLFSMFGSAQSKSDEWSKYNESLFDAIITLNIKELNNYANIVFNKITNMLSDIGNSFYNFIQTTLTTYSLLITMLFFIIFVAILLFAKDKLGNILVLSYFYTGFLISSLFTVCIKWIMILYNKGKKLVLLIYDFLKLLLQEAPLTLENYWTMIKTVFYIIGTVISICFTLFIFFWTAIAVEFLVRLANVLFITIDENNENSTLDFMEILGKIYTILAGTFNSMNGDK